MCVMMQVEEVFGSKLDILGLYCNAMLPIMNATKQHSVVYANLQCTMWEPTYEKLQWSTQTRSTNW